MFYNSFTEEAIQKLKENDLFDKLAVVYWAEKFVYDWWNQQQSEDGPLTPIAGNIITYDDDFKEKTVLGSFRCIHLSCYDELHRLPHDLHKVARAYSRDLLTAVQAVTDENGELYDDYRPGGGVMYLDHFGINPEYRRQGIGLISLPMIISLAGKGTGVATTIPRPVALHEDKEGQEGFIPQNDPEYQKAQERITKLLDALGFQATTTLAEDNVPVWSKPLI